MNRDKPKVQRSKTDLDTLRKTWTELKHVQLLDTRQQEEERSWDQEFSKRKNELEQQQHISSKKRIQNKARLADISARWRSLERKRLEKSEFYLERFRTSLSLAASRQEAMSYGSPAVSFDR
ncbi:uncharacterized protein LOC128229636 isoform X2 [Mya arenaria]|uniref:uncharacterized protein LOC128229636 isoform X2 n=1 Tax=Mya arenaria TaxID=6604 RepID=UPI0022E62A7A|nr:uncharacterized protein LOC128229636 isoform X2 [Mya arenaria]